MEFYLVRPSGDNAKATKEVIVRGLTLAKKANSKLILAVNTYSQACDSGCLRYAIGIDAFTMLNKKRSAVVASVDVRLMTYNAISGVSSGIQDVVVCLWPKDKVIRTITTLNPHIKAILTLEWQPESLEIWRRDMKGMLITST